jgi:hypothetical protein
MPKVGVIKESSFKNNLTIYPNPANSDITIDLPFTESNFHWSISTIAGQTLVSEEKQALGKQLKLDLSQLENGIYIIQLQSGNLGYYQKLIINH